MPPRARQASLSVWQSAQHSRAAQEQKDNCGTTPCHQSLTESLSEEHHRAEVAQEQTQVSNQEAQSRLLSKTSLYLSLSSLRIRFSGLRPLAGSLPKHAVPNHSVCSGAEPTNHIGSCQPAAAVKRRRVCAGLCKQTTARTGQIYPRTLTPRRARARNRVVICQQKVRSTESKKAELRNHQKKRAVPKKQKKQIPQTGGGAVSESRPPAPGPGVVVGVLEELV